MILKGILTSDSDLPSPPISCIIDAHLKKDALPTGIDHLDSDAEQETVTFQVE